MKNPVRGFRIAYFHYVWVCLWFIGIGIISDSLCKFENPSPEELANKVAIKGKVLEIANKTSGDKILVDVLSSYNKEGKKRNHINFLLYVRSDAVRCNIGNIIIAPIKGWRKIEELENTFKSGYTQYMNDRGIFYSSEIHGEDIKILKSDFSFKGLISDFHDKMVSFIEKQPISSDTKKFIIPLLTGDRAYLDETTRKNFADAGVAHILALSGFHIGIIVSIILALLFPLNFIGKYRLRLLLTAMFLWGYALKTGMSASTVRACIMATVFIIAIIFERKNTSLNSLSTAGFIILLINPNSINDIGFQLSFLCVGSLILFSKKLNPIRQRLHPRLYNIYGILLATLITTFSSWIVTGYYFGTFPTMFLPSNLIILPLLPFYVFIILFYLLLNSFNLELHFIGSLIDKIFILMKRCLTIFGNDYLQEINIPLLSLVFWMIGLLGITIIFYYKRSFFLKATVAGCFIASIAIICLTQDQIPTGIIIGGSPREFVLIAGNKNKEDKFTFKRGKISLHSLYGKRILIVDAPISYGFKEHAKPNPYLINQCKSKGRIHYIILGSGFKGDISGLDSIFNPEKFIIHPSCRKKKEDKMLNEADSLKIPIHSIRKDKPFKVYI